MLNIVNTEHFRPLEYGELGLLVMLNIVNTELLK